MFKMKPALNAKNILPWENGHNPVALPEHVLLQSQVSLVIPIYNSGEFLEKTLRSILMNDLRGVQIIVSDGGSTDQTHQVLDHYEDMFDVVISEPDEGQSDAINKGFAKANGEILCWLNGDDLFLENALNKVRHFYVENNKPDFIVGNAFMTEIDFTPINRFVFSEEKLGFEYLLNYAQNHLIQPSVFFSKAAWDKCGPLDIHDHYAMDADLFITMSKNFSGHHLDSDLAYSVYHEACKTRGKRAESITQLALVQAKHGGFREAKETLDILVNLFNEINIKLDNQPTQTFTKFQEEIYDLVMTGRNAK
jgi:glycosyltransferase involved in cell wall biosynthesis